MTPEQILLGARTAIGSGSLLVPRTAGRLFGLDPVGNPQTPYVARLFGVRDAALAYGLVASQSPSQRALWLRVGIACDLSDAVAGVLAGRAGELPRFASVLVTGTALFAAGLGISVLKSDPAGA